MRQVPFAFAEGSASPPVEQTPLPIAKVAEADTRFVDAWREWLGKLATDAEAALAAAMAYKELDAEGRDTWIDALQQDAESIPVPRIALYAPLLAVEADAARRDRIASAMGNDVAAASPRAPATALSGNGPGEIRVAAIITPLYLDFVQVLACGYRTHGGFEWVRHDPIVARDQSPRQGAQLGGAVLESTPLKALVDDLAHAVLAHTRSHREVPEALQVLADLFGPCESGSTIPPAP
jgi:hypothetical protein